MKASLFISFYLVTISFFFVLQVKSSKAQDGTIDQSFSVGTGANSQVNRIEIQADQKIIVGGEFSLFNSTVNRGLVRLLPNGSIDLDYINNLNRVNGPVRASALQSDGKLLIGGLFDTIGFFTRKNMARIDSSGQLDTSFQTGIGFNNEVFAISENGQRILAAGFFNSYNGTTVPSLVCLLPNGQRDTSFILANNVFLSINVVHLMPNNMAYIGGNMTNYNGTPVGRLIRLHPNGTLDTTFNIGTGFSSTVTSLTIQPDGKLLVGGNFSTVNGQTHNRIVRLNPNGSIDTTFNSGTGANSNIPAICVQNDGKILIGGGFTTYNGVAITRLARLLSNGSIDTSFTQAFSVNGGITSIKLQANGRIVAAGGFSSYNNVQVSRVVRLNNTGCIPPTQPTISTSATVKNCPSNAITLSISSGSLNSGNQWRWYPNFCGGISIGIGDSIQVNPTTTTTYFVRGEGNCTGPCAQVTITVIDTIPPVPNINPIFNTLAYCTTTISLIPTAADLCAGTITATTTDPLTYNLPGTYTINWLYNDGNGNTTSQTQTVIIDSIVNVVDMDPTFIVPTLATTHSSATAQYQWVNCDLGFQAIAGENMPIFSPTQTGNYALVVSEGSCKDTSNCYYHIANNAQNQEGLLVITVYPNPNNGILFFGGLPAVGNIQARLFNVKGQQVLQKANINQDSNQIEIDQLPAGVYILEIQAGETSSIKKIVKF